MVLLAFCWLCSFVVWIGVRLWFVVFGGLVGLLLVVVVWFCVGFC